MATSKSFEEYVYSGQLASLIEANRWLGALILNLMFRYPCLSRSQAVDIIQQVEPLGSDRDAKRVIRACFNKLGIQTVSRTACRQFALKSEPVFDSATTVWNDRIEQRLRFHSGPRLRQAAIPKGQKNVPIGKATEQPLYSLAIDDPGSPLIKELRKSLLADSSGANISKTMLRRHWIAMAELHIEFTRSDEQAAAGLIAVNDLLAAYRQDKCLDFYPLINSPSRLISEFEKLEAESRSITPEKSTAVARTTQGTFDNTISIAQTAGWSRVRFW